MQIIMLGTGHALVTECYNTCFVLQENNRNLLVDGGGGNALFGQLKRVGIAWHDIREIFITHKHVDHLLGILWMVRMICQSMHKGEYEGQACIYGHAEVIHLLCNMAKDLLLERETKFIGDRLHLIPVEDGETRQILGRPVTFFDMCSPKTKQFGFCMTLPDGKELTCCGDEPCSPAVYDYVHGSKWLLHEAFCLSDQADFFRPYEKHHSTVKDACQLAETLRVENLLLYHTEDQNLKRRKVLYTEEGKQYFHGKIWVPEDLESLTL